MTPEGDFESGDRVRHTDYPYTGVIEVSDSGAVVIRLVNAGYGPLNVIPLTGWTIA